MSSPYLSQLLRDLKNTASFKRKPKKDPVKIILESPDEEEERAEQDA